MISLNVSLSRYIFIIIIIFGITIDFCGSRWLQNIIRIVLPQITSPNSHSAPVSLLRPMQSLRIESYLIVSDYYVHPHATCHPGMADPISPRAHLVFIIHNMFVISRAGLFPRHMDFCNGFLNYSNLHYKVYGFPQLVHCCITFDNNTELRKHCCICVLLCRMPSSGFQSHFDKRISVHQICINWSVLLDITAIS